MNDDESITNEIALREQQLVQLKRYEYLYMESNPQSIMINDCHEPKLSKTRQYWKDCMQILQDIQTLEIRINNLKLKLKQPTSSFQKYIYPLGE